MKSSDAKFSYKCMSHEISWYSSGVNAFFVKFFSGKSISYGSLQGQHFLTQFFRGKKERSVPNRVGGGGNFRCNGPFLSPVQLCCLGSYKWQSSWSEIGEVLLFWVAKFLVHLFKQIRPSSTFPSPRLPSFPLSTVFHFAWIFHWRCQW